jgi:hypothetical protein
MLHLPRMLVPVAPLDDQNAAFRVFEMFLEEK